jgi:hypothetical protein
MEIAHDHASTPTQLWIGRAERRCPLKVDYYSELRTWVQHAIMEAEEKKAFGKRDQLLSLLKDL